MGASRVLIISLLLLVLYSGISFADSCSLPSIALNLSPSPLFSVLALAFMLSFLVIAIGVMINKAVPGTKLGEWLKNEYWEMAKSAILIAGAISILVFAGNISLLLIGQQATGSYTMSGLNQILNTLSSSSGQALCSIYDDINNFGSSESGFPESPLGIVTGIATWKTINVGYWLPIPIPGVGAFTFGSKFQVYNNPMLESIPQTPMGQFESIVNDIINFLYFPVSSLVALMYILTPLIVYIGIMIFVPLGIIFRAFPFLRPIGGTLFAFGVGLSIVFPLLIILINMPLTSILYNTLNYSPIPTTGNELLDGIIKVLLAAANTILTGIYPEYNFFSAIPLTISIYPALNIYAPYFMFLFAEFVFFLIDLMIWYPLVDSIAKSLGGTIRLELGGKLRIG
ncbi:MAG: hypothetical protein RXO43_00385 [Candidatus Micrarchaeota archaeon]